MKKLFFLLLVSACSMGFAQAQTETQSIDVAWTGKGGGCWCPTDICLEVCWCDTLADTCVAGTEACNESCDNTLQPWDVLSYHTLSVNVPAGRKIISKKLLINFSCGNSFEFDLMLPDGYYEFQNVHSKPGCPPVHITYSNGHIQMFTGN